MPFKSNKQRKFLFANKPEVAQEFAAAERTAAVKTKPKHKRKSLKQVFGK